MIGSLIKSNLVDISPVSCLVLIEMDDAVASQIIHLAGDMCSIERFRDIEDAAKWLSTYPSIDLLIVGNNTSEAIVSRLRKLLADQSTPVLIAAQQIRPTLVKAALRTGATDILDINGDNYSLQFKIRYYLDLKTRILALPVTKRPSDHQPIKLPVWKRTIDIAVSLVILILISPILLLVSLLIKLDSKGPILYKSKRAGTNFRIFNMYKFRTMSTKADQQLHDLASQNIYSKPSLTPLSDGLLDDYRSAFLCDSCRQRGVSCQQPLIDQHQLVCEKLFLRENEDAAKFMKFRNDPRITRLGTILRNSSIDELPQLFNILLGDMSLVGNRPLPLYEAEKLTSDEFAKRFAGPAGLTGLWQIKKRAKGQGPMSDWERTQLDIEYANTFSFKTDMFILWKTLFSLWQKENV